MIRSEVRIDFDLLGQHVHAWDSIALLNGHMYESSLAPLGAPGVLNDPDVRLSNAAPSKVTLLVWHERLVWFGALLCFSFVPGSWPAGFSHANPGADNYHCVIDFLWTVIFGWEDPRFIVAPAVVASWHCDRHWPILDRLFHRRHAFHMLNWLDLRKLLFVLVSAWLIFSHVGIVPVRRGTIAHWPLPVCPHPATSATIRCRDAVHTLLLRKPDRFFTCLNGLHGGLCSWCREGPARATPTLILDWNNFLFIGPVDVLANGRCVFQLHVVSIFEFCLMSFKLSTG